MTSRDDLRALAARILHVRAGLQNGGGVGHEIVRLEEIERDLRALAAAQETPQEIICKGIVIPDHAGADYYCNQGHPAVRINHAHETPAPRPAEGMQ